MLKYIANFYSTIFTRQPMGDRRRWAVMPILRCREEGPELGFTDGYIAHSNLWQKKLISTVSVQSAENLRCSAREQRVLRVRCHKMKNRQFRRCSPVHGT